MKSSACCTSASRTQRRLAKDAACTSACAWRLRSGQRNEVLCRLRLSAFHATPQAAPKNNHGAAKTTTGDLPLPAIRGGGSVSHARLRPPPAEVRLGRVRRRAAAHAG